MNGAMFVDGDNICMHFRDSSKRIHLDEDIEWKDLFLALEMRGISLITKKFYIIPYELHPEAANNLRHLGFSIIPTEVYGDKSLTDDYILVDAMETILENPVNVLIVVSGDKDYLPLARKAREKGIEVIFIAFDKDTAEVLKNEFKFIDMTPFVRLEALVGDVSTVGMSSTVEVKGDTL
ncbi:MAG: hypothetical protein DRN92_00560 [Thermoproteota archaeon]|nr:MAG: hypothetical protein DRN92_00560 [Candidatus Korarchaeota archaeon]